MAEMLPISTKHCRVERDGAVLILTMNRPEARNALSPEMLVGLADGYALLDEDPELRCGILTGAGGTFSSGADLKAMSTPSERAATYATAWRRSRTCIGRRCCATTAAASRSSPRSRATRWPAAPRATNDVGQFLQGISGKIIAIAMKMPASGCGRRKRFP